MHFTFQAPSNPDLQQGDLLRKTDKLRQLLQEVHPHYLRTDYAYFVVLTQSCDLVRRPNGGGKRACKSRYINIAAVRPLDIVVKREIERYQGPLETRADICSRSKRDRVEMFLERLLNNNEDDYFYIHAEPSAGVPDNMCAFLRLSISIRAYQHYDLCVESRCLSLKPMFQAKLGWLIGNMYSRVGTDDWTPDHYSEDEFDKIVSRLMDTACVWVNEPKLREARRVLKDEFQGLERDALRERIEALSIEPKIDRIVDRVVEVLMEAGTVRADPAESGRIRNRLRNDPSLAKLAK